jgi:hypothetical protein
MKETLVHNDVFILGNMYTPPLVEYSYEQYKRKYDTILQDKHFFSCINPLVFSRRDPGNPELGCEKILIQQIL